MGLFRMLGGEQGRRIDESLLLDSAAFAHVARAPPGRGGRAGTTMFGTPALPANFVECNGQVLNDPESPYDGQTIPLLNGASEDTKRFLRGSSTSGTTGGSVQHGHGGTTGGPIDVVWVNADPLLSAHVAESTHTHTFTTDTRSHLPPHYEVVWIMRIK